MWIPMRLGMSESLCTDSPSWGRTMPRAYSSDLRERAIELVDMEGASRHEAAELLGVSVSSAVRWLQRWQESGSAEPMPRGGSVSPLEKVAAEVLALIAERPDLTLVEMVAELRRRRIRTSRSALSRFFGRHDITLKKKPAGCGTGASRRGPRASTLDSRARHA
jgi:transposase